LKAYRDRSGGEPSSKTTETFSPPVYYTFEAISIGNYHNIPATPVQRSPVYVSVSRVPELSSRKYPFGETDGEPYWVVLADCYGWYLFTGGLMGLNSSSLGKRVTPWTSSLSPKTKRPIVYVVG